MLSFDYHPDAKQEVENRVLSVFGSYESECYDSVTGGVRNYTLISMGAWGSSVWLAWKIAGHFGGWVLENDSTDEWIEQEPAPGFVIPNTAYREKPNEN